MHTMPLTSQFSTPEDMDNTYGDPVPRAAAPVYSTLSGYPAPYTDANNSIHTQGQVPGADRGNWGTEFSKFAEYIDQAVGGQSGTKDRLGWSTGLAKLDRNVHHFTGRSVVFVRRNLAKDTGPVGQDNYGSKLASGVDSQFLANAPSLEDIYYGMVGR